MKERLDLKGLDVAHHFCTVELLLELLLFHRAAELRGVEHLCPLGSQGQLEGECCLDQSG